MACHFTYRIVDSGIYFWGDNNGNIVQLSNSDGTEYNPQNNPNNDWATAIKKLKVEAAVSGISNIAVFFTADNYIFDTDVEHEEYEIGSDFSSHRNYIGYNPNSGKITITKIGNDAYTETCPFRYFLTDYTFDSGAGNVYDFYTHMVRDGLFMGSFENRAMFTYISNSMGGPPLTSSGERKYFGQAIRLDQLSNVPIGKLSKILSCTTPYHISIKLIMTLCRSGDNGRSLCYVKSVAFTDAITVKTVSYNIEGNMTTTGVMTNPITTSINDTPTGVFGNCTIDLDKIEDDWLEKTKRIRMYSRYW